MLLSCLLFALSLRIGASAGVQRLSRMLHRVPKGNRYGLIAATAMVAGAGTLINGQDNEQYDKVTRIIIEFKAPAVTTIEHQRVKASVWEGLSKSFNGEKDAWRTVRDRQSRYESEETIDEWQVAGLSSSRKSTSTHTQDMRKSYQSYVRYYRDPAEAYRWFILSGNSKVGRIAINMSEFSDERTRADYKQCNLVLSRGSVSLQGITEDTDTRWDNLHEGESSIRKTAEKVTFENINQPYTVTLQQQSWWDWICCRHAASCTVQDNRSREGRSKDTR